MVQPRIFLSLLLTQKPTQSLIAHSCGQIAQSVEQRTENPRVAGSIPALATIEIK